ncbi:MAG: hypothetical protein ACXWHB_00670 [Usitatibacter sp.]
MAEGCTASSTFPASNGRGPNHRYTTDPWVLAAMQAKGWIPEGVHFCAPPRNN